MKYNLLLKSLKFTIKWLESIEFKYSTKNLNSSYSSLSPIDNGDEGSHYSNALLWALTNRKKEDIKNIALTGPYGSGKSTILKTFQKNYKGNDLKFLPISLATFKEEKKKNDDSGKDSKVDDNNLLRLIEVSILEQIFYHEEDKKIPDSRFKKIKSYSGKKLFWYSLGYLLFLIAFYDFFNPSFIQSIFKNLQFSDPTYKWIHLGGILISLVGVFIIIFNSVRVISTLTINNLKFQNAEIGVGDKLNKSVLNHHIDEILYFFSVCPYNVVIIEDLDRFQETEIFTKLREVNLLLNSSEKTKSKEIVFIYAVRDDMFTDKERTKFFDFIIPVIPVINSSNSSEILLKKKKDFQYNLSDNLIEDISLFIDDMRLLHNITNEFYLYKQQLNENLNHDKLFAIITYKNIYPNDFMKLSCNEGELYDIIDSKSRYIQNIIISIEAEIEEAKKKISDLNNLFIRNIKDLRVLYIAKIIDTLDGFISFNIKNQILTIEEATSDENFEYLKNSKFSFNYFVSEGYSNRYSHYNQSPSYENFNIIEQFVDKNKSYKEKEKEIIELKNGVIKELRNKILDLEKQKNKIRSFKFTELIKSNQMIDFDTVKNLNKNFIYILIKNGYIAEDYIDYISLFHEESITRADYQYHINVKNEICQPYEYKLFKIDKLLPKINLIDFDKEYVLNYDLLDYLLLNNNSYKGHLNLMFNKLADESKASVEFIVGYFSITPNLPFFIKTLCQHWSNIWNVIEKELTIESKVKNQIFESIIEFADIDSIKAISLQSSLIKRIISNKYFLCISEDHQKLKNIINEFKIKFVNLDFDLSPPEMIDFIYKNDYYKINILFIVSLIKKYGEFNQIEFDNANYSFIKESKADKLIIYVEENINEYVENCYLKIDANINEKEEYLIELLNNNDLYFKNRELVIGKVQTKITYLTSINKVQLFSLLLKNNRIMPKWENLLHEYDNYVLQETEDNEITLVSDKPISESSIEYINLIENAEKLSKVKIPIEVNSKNIYGTFWKKMLQNNQISDEAYDLITKSSPWSYNTLDLSKLSKSKLLSLINNNCLIADITNYNALKDSFNALNIRLLEERKIEYFEIVDDLTFDSDDLELVFKSNILNNTEKLQIVNVHGDDVINHYNNLSSLCSILLEEESISLNENIISKVLTTKYLISSIRIKLFNKQFINYDFPFIDLFLKNMENEYTAIGDKSSKAKIKKNEENKLFLSLLVNNNYISSFSEHYDYYRINHKKQKG
ncbi:MULTISPECIES: hypothetical protein [unclassified Arcicella]|uniref:YobI family P-loop NTPase n=1 Tax=unclassified Arcicella TaxID=2644986 RepID=UPI0028580995|nr:MULTISPECIES: hypothetical protein [unclassified Arcicella]MDR6563966.1 hypothetical protein [Arcicella sp. BE51]MDR6813719.1 hypothetical protein [Arcicella sp. BE140]MDR6825031.1 hypothetical protein [Arcicella sp. BE139]